MCNATAKAEELLQGFDSKSARLRDLRNQFGITIVSRPRKPSSAHEYALLGGEAGV